MTESNKSVVDFCRAYLSNSPIRQPSIPIPENKTTTANEPPALITEASTSTITESKSSPPPVLALVPPDPDALTKGITLTQENVDDIDTEIVKDTYDIRKSVF